MSTTKPKTKIKEKTRLPTPEAARTRIPTLVFSAPAPAPKAGTPNWLPLFILALITVAAVWWFGGPHLILPTSAPTVNTTPPINASANAALTTPGAQILLKSFDQLVGLPSSFEIAFQEQVNGVDTNITLRQAGQTRSALLVSPFSRQEYYWSGNGTVACETPLDNPRSCALVNTSVDTPVRRFALIVQSTFPNNNAPLQRDLNTQMLHLGIIKFLAPPQEMAVNGRPCHNLIYSLNYQNLSDAQLASIGKTAKDADVLVFKDYRLEKCVDAQWGIAMRSQLKYTVFSQPLQYSHQVSSFQIPFPGGIDVPAADANDTAMQMLFAGTSQLLQTMGTCNALSTPLDRDVCIRTNAITDKRLQFCDMTSNSTVRDQCVLIVANVKDDPADCLGAGTLVNECYISIAANRKDASLCSLIGDIPSQTTCKGVVANATANLPTFNQTASANSPTNGTTFPARGAID